MISLAKLVDRVLAYEDKNLQLKALSAVPVSEISFRASQLLRGQQKAAVESSQTLEEAELYEYFFLCELANWFKNDYFSWVDVKHCTECDVDMAHVTNYAQKGTPHEPSQVFTVEVFKCSICGQSSEFPRYNDAHMLLMRKEGRCCEWAQVFTLIARALGWRARFVYDLTDHAWTEVFSSISNRWIHCDPCEGLVDSPLVYELGWGKKLTFIFAASCEDIQDVTWRYSCDHKSLIARRLPHLEKNYLHQILQIRGHLLSDQSPNRRIYILKGIIRELAELMIEPNRSGHYKGRISGSHAWREARSELGLSTQKGYIWSPLKNEVEMKELILSYCSSNDIYLRNGTKADDIFFGWQNYTFYTSNLFRKEEKDWKMTYLAKQDESKVGVITWKFDLSNTFVLVKSIKVKCSSFVLNSGNVRWEIKSEGFPVVTVENADYFETSTLENSISFTLSAFVGEKLDSSWQHSQLFRQPSNVLDFPFIVTVSLKAKSER